MRLGYQHEKFQWNSQVCSFLEQISLKILVDLGLEVDLFQLTITMITHLSSEFTKLNYLISTSGSNKHLSSSPQTIEYLLVQERVIGNFQQYHYHYITGWCFVAIVIITRPFDKRWGGRQLSGQGCQLFDSRFGLLIILLSGAILFSNDVSVNGEIRLYLLLP